MEREKRNKTKQNNSTHGEGENPSKKKKKKDSTHGNGENP
jgi:hypothetical protein